MGDSAVAAAVRLRSLRYRWDAGLPLAVLTGLAWWVGRPTVARVLAAVTFASAVAMIALEHLASFWGRPPLSFVIPLLACLAPTLVRPAVGERRPRVDDRAVAALATISAASAALWFAAVDVYLAHKYRYAQFWTGRGPDFYRLIVVSVARGFPSSVSLRSSPRLDCSSSADEPWPSA